MKSLTFKKLELENLKKAFILPFSLLQYSDDSMFFNLIKENWHIKNNDITIEDKYKNINKLFTITKTQLYDICNIAYDSSSLYEFFNYIAYNVVDKLIIHNKNNTLANIKIYWQLTNDHDLTISLIKDTVCETTVKVELGNKSIAVTYEEDSVNIVYNYKDKIVFDQNYIIWDKEENDPGEYFIMSQDEKIDKDIIIADMEEFERMIRDCENTISNSGSIPHFIKDSFLQIILFLVY